MQQDKDIHMSHESEAELEKKLIDQLCSMSYEPVQIQDEESLLDNLKRQLESFNETTYSKKEFDIHYRQP